MRSLSPSDLLSTSSPLVLLALVAACACADYTLIEDIPYDQRHGERTTLDVYLPEPPPPPGSPAVILIHGGGWSSGSKDHFADEGERLADAGYVGFSINYRLVPEGAYPNLFQDVYCALGFIEENADEYFVDTSRIAVMGYSAGAHLAGLLGTTGPEGDFAPDCGTTSTIRPAAVISGAGPSDLTLFPDNPATEDLLGGDKDELPDLYRIASPLTYVTPDDPPFLLIHGTDDLIVRYEHAEVMEEALQEAGVDVRVLKVRGGGHIINPGADLIDAALVQTVTDTPEAWPAVLDFLDDTLGQP